ncbi:MAG: lytic transglycosylase domain-containing protein [Armatimonadetes bacterium]|nr:lytic transglycosylase domain-containing protein [Armatimonadota bacterium]
MKIHPLGPQRIQERMRQIEARMSELFGAEMQKKSGDTATVRPGAPVGGVGAGVLRPLGAFAADRSALTVVADSAADEFGLDRALFRALIGAESGWNSRAVSPKGAQGLAQLMPATAGSLGVTEPFDPAQNLRGGARYLRRMLDEFGTVDLALAAYNAGPGAVRRYGGIPPYSETQAYVRKILAEIRG